ncbi:DUF1553 domain-containing protein [Schlesneria paludicola]|uniref:DUF1553 domain-containing protein n=1 Tax=Schlesneria paludicola TaxID=360056 RepID=UPI00029A94B7|nr:DUF1553 domain-containing protein [Schlesneria paludicola]
MRQPTTACRPVGTGLRSVSLSTLKLCLPVVMTCIAYGADEPVDYLKKIKPILSARCVSCHGVLKQEGGLRLDTAAQAIKGGDSGAAITPGEPSTSLLLTRVSAPHESERMPPEGEPLKPEQIAAIRNWVSQQAPHAADEQPERDPHDHWSFKAVVRPAVPRLEHPSEEQTRWLMNPIDALISVEHRQRGIAPQVEASRSVWLRRVSLDLIGLPPSTAELDAFNADQSPDAYDKVVTRLLDSPQYGERWGRHWMDIWRYSDWWGLGAEVRNSQKHIWHWRDWIIESLNADKPYDQMLREMLAADELYPNDFDRLRATGYLARQYFIFNRTTWMDETVEHTSKSMLGLTLNCAKCHDHKYDPLSHVDYYSLRAIFEPYQIRTEMVPGQMDYEKDGIPRAFDAHLDEPTYLHIRGNDLNPDKSRVIPPAVPAILVSDRLKLTIEPISLPAEAPFPGLRDFVVQAHRNAAHQQIATARSAVETAEQSLRESEFAASAERDASIADALRPSNASTPALLHDNFSTPRPDLWEQFAGNWAYENGRLVQTQTGPARAALRLKQLPPTDFEAKLKYIPGAGGTWKSVGISCDVTDAGNELLAYVSAVTGQPKSQIAFKQGREYVYPPNAFQSCKVELHQPHDVVLRVRGTLLNMSFDGQHSIAFRLPSNLSRQSGHMELIAFDAAAEFLSFELYPLPPETKLIEDADYAKSTATTVLMPVDQAQLALSIAKKAHVTAQMQLASIEARATADQAVYGHRQPSGVTSSNDSISDSHTTMTLVLAASKSELSLAASRADEAFCRAELARLQAPADKKEEAEKKLTAAKSTLEAAVKAMETPKETHTPLPGAKKTQEDYQNRNADKPFPASSSGRRAAFAKWLTDPRNPLPARVAVNHIWTRHMGKPLVATVFDFGRNGAPPTHPALLDWLASELVEQNWSMKHLHRLIVLSETYRLSSSSANASDATLAADSDNRFYWRMNPVRMESQVVRDSLLFLAGELDLSMGGPSIAINDETSRRRSLYFVHSHNDHQKFLSTFDDASVLDCYRRAESIVPQQALALENSSFVTRMAGKISQRLANAQPDASDGDFIRSAYLSVLSVEPTSEEQATMSEILSRLTELARAKKRPNPESLARTTVVQTLINLNDFITIR